MLSVGAPSVQCLTMVPSLFVLQTSAYSRGLAFASACFNLDLLPILWPDTMPSTVPASGGMTGDYRCTTR
jgi:hypothetical protein